ncbi:alpha-L-fucosidase [Sciscionella sediminilitoris]|uniref:alpha-L-fucosidase n=1 Tax=Sciscionella sediminilitoris TaxID=1445613 RepID=UPI00068A35FB|nr:alpha-L-fucosidase [Sciscionella sp. SE31]
MTAHEPHSRPAPFDRRRLLAAGGLAAGGLAAGALFGSPATPAFAGQKSWVPTSTGPYTPTVDSLRGHPLPDWFDDRKFGIFVHWGLYSVPAWAPVGKEYAEWYWSQMNDRSDPTFRHELDTYGPRAAYDDFIAGFTAERFAPHSWVRLFERAGAGYFVFVTKHHDGFALFDTAASGRSSTRLGPRRDLLGELFQAARTSAPGLKRGTYYSLPEWYNPAYPGYQDNFPGGAPKQYYTGEPLPYTGATPIRDYVEELQVRQMVELIERYDTDILWGDIGGPNNSLPLLAHYYNRAAQRGKEVVVNDRMGVEVADFTTPEYEPNPPFHAKKWEGTRGIDPHSFGYNAATPISEYATAENLVHTLVDSVSKNGNLLLDIGPRADGTIPRVMVERLESIGDWLRINGPAIYRSRYWSTQAEGKLRFTTTPGAFHIISLGWPGRTLEVNAPVPIAAHAPIRLLGHHGPSLPWSRSTGKLVVTLPEEGPASTTSKYAYTFTFPTKHS